MTALDSVPAQYELASPETIPLAWDVTNYLSQGDALQASPVPVFSITDQNTGTDVSATLLDGSPSVSGSVITQVIRGAVSGHWYTLIGTFTVSATKVLSFRTILVADF